MTLRELAIVSKGERFRHETALRVALQGAWMAVALDRQKRLPGLKRFMRDSFPLPPGSPEAIADERDRWIAWAARHNLKVIRKNG